MRVQQVQEDPKARPSEATPSKTSSRTLIAAPVERRSEKEQAWKVWLRHKPECVAYVVAEQWYAARTLGASRLGVGPMDCDTELAPVLNEAQQVAEAKGGVVEVSEALVKEMRTNAAKEAQAAEPLGYAVRWQWLRDKDSTGLKPKAKVWVMAEQWFPHDQKRQAYRLLRDLQSDKSDEIERRAIRIERDGMPAPDAGEG